MPKFAKYILVAAGSLLLVYLLAVLGLNIYLQSERVQKRFQAAAELAAGSPVRIQGTHYTPWSGFVINGITVNGDSQPGEPPFLSASAVSFRFSLLALLQGKLRVSEVVVRDPSLVSLVVPPAPRRPEMKPSPSTAPPAVVTSPGAAISVPGPSPLPATPPAEIEVKRVRVVNGKASFYDSQGALALTLTGVKVSGELQPDGSVAGTYHISTTSVGAFVHPYNVKGTFVWKNGRLSLPDLRADWAGGKVTGTLETSRDRGFSANVSAERVLIKRLADDAGIDGEGTRGSLFAKANLSGTAGKPETFAGRADISLQQARFQPMDFVRQIGELMRIQELQMFELKTAEAGLGIHDKKVVVENLVLQSENLVLDAKGPVGFDGKMKLQARLHLNGRLRKDLGGLLDNNFKESEREGYQQMPFSITGTVRRPKTDLLDKLTGFHLGEDVGGLLKNLFRALPQKPKDEADKKPGGN